MDNNEIKNFISISHEKLQYDDVAKTYFSIYTDVLDELAVKLNDMFAYWHYRINQELEILNSYSKQGYKYYHAVQSRTIIVLIKDVFAFVKQFENSAYEFAFDEEYKQVFLKCQSFLQSRGSTIPEDYGIVSLLYRAIFTYTNCYIEKERGYQYKLHLIGSGAYADVFKYYDNDYACQFALKRLKKNVSDKDIKRFHKEYELMCKYRYPYITTVYNFNKANNYYTMEYYTYNLEKFISANNTKLVFSQRKSIVLQFLKGLKYLHKNGILHRDLSYRNIMIQPYGDLTVVKISDFGLAKDDKELITSPDSSLKGTILDPCLQSFESYDIQNEIYSIGFVLWYIFTGRKNFKSENTAISSIVSRCINSDKNVRYQNIDNLFYEISKVQNMEDTPILPISISEIKNKIIDTLYSFSANELPDVCVSLGLKEGTVEEAFQSKRKYVSKRLHEFDIGGCEQLIDNIKMRHGIEIILI